MKWLEIQERINKISWIIALCILIAVIVTLIITGSHLYTTNKLIGIIMIFTGLGIAVMCQPIHEILHDKMEYLLWKLYIRFKA